MRTFLSFVAPAILRVALVVALPLRAADLTSSQLIGEGKASRKLDYTQTKLKTVNLSAHNFIVCGIKDPNESLTLYVTEASKFIRNGQPASLSDAKIGDNVSGLFHVIDKRATAISTTFRASAEPVKQTR